MLAATKAETATIEAGEKADAELAELLKAALSSEDQESRKEAVVALIARGRVAKGALSKRKETRRKYAVSSGNGGKIENMIKRALPHRTEPSPAPSLATSTIQPSPANGIRSPLKLMATRRSSPSAARR